MPEDSPIKTDFPIALGGKEYTLTYPVPAIWKLEDATGLHILEGGISVEDWTGKTVRERLERVVDLVWAGLSTHHPEMTREKVGAFVYLKNLPYVEQTAAEAFAASMPQAAKVEAEGSDPLPQTSSPN